MTVVPIASGSGGNATLLVEGGRSLLLDCGLPWNTLRRSCTPWPDGVLLSHEHSDHASGVAGALAVGVPVYASAETSAALPSNPYIPVTTLPRSPEPVEIRPGRVPPWRVTPVPTEHDGARGPLAFVVDAPFSTDRAVYAVDCPFLHNRVAGVTHWLIEANYDERLIPASVDEAQYRHILRGHMSIEQALALLQANDLSRTREIWLLHLSDRHSDAAGFRARVQRQTGLPCHVAPAQSEVLEVAR